VLVRCVIRSKSVGVRVLLLETLDVLQTIVIIIVITFMQGIYSYITEANRVSRLYSVATVL
jgi:hypothetical protein